MERIKMKGIGTAKMIIKTASSDILDLISNSSGTDYCNLELRKGGIIVGFMSQRQIYAWAIPYYKLVIFNQSNELSIYDGAHKLQLEPAFNAKIDRKFLIKILELKASFN
jgi:hypothetical protein